MTQWVNFAEIRSRVSLEDVILHYYRITNLKQDGRKLIGPCPVHNGDSPRAFHADLDKNVWHCFSRCQRGGNQLDFVALKENVTIREAALRLQTFFMGQGNGKKPDTSVPVNDAGRSQSKTTETSAPSSGISNKQEEPEPPNTNSPLNIKLDLKPDHPHLLQDRKLKVETVKQFGIGYCSRGIMRGCIAIPVHDQEGELVAYAGRRLKATDIKEYGKYKFPKGFRKELVLYNFHRAKEAMKEQGLILVEGFFAALKLHEVGFANTVAAMGCELSEAQVELLGQAKEAILLLDGDEAGRAGTKAARDKLAGKTVVRVVHLHSGMKPDHLSAKALRWLINGLQALDLAEVNFTFRQQEEEGSDRGEGHG